MGHFDQILPREKRRGSSLFRHRPRQSPFIQFTVPMAIYAGQIDGESQANGVRLPLAQFVDRGHSIGTGLRGNLRHFKPISALSVMQL